MYEVIVIGTSWGGLEAVSRLLDGLHDDVRQPIVVVQHRSTESEEGALAQLLAHHTKRTVCDPDDKTQLEPYHVYLGPPDYHLLVEAGHLALSTDQLVQYARPSIDVLFSTAAESFRERCVGVVLTGANADGARGLARIAELGGTAIVQDPGTAARTEMPAAALAAVPQAHVARVGEIACLVVERCGIQTAAA